MKERLRGFKAVYSFTFKQTAGTKSFQITTALIAILLAGALILINIFGAGAGKKETGENTGTGTGDDNTENAFSVEKVLIMDESGLGDIGFSADFLGNEDYVNIQFEKFSGSDVKEALSSPSFTDGTLLLQITKEEKAYVLKALLPEGSLVKEKDANKLLAAYSNAFQLIKYNIAGLTEEQLAMAVKSVTFSYSDIGEDNSIASIIVKMIAPMLFSFLLYFMLILYGQTVSKSVSGEKTSKLVETLLVSVRPDALIAGKVMAVAVQGVMQFAIWIAALFIGLYGGNALAGYIYPGYTNPVVSVIDMIKETVGQSALSLPAVMISLVFFFLGFLFYSVLAALAGSMVSKPEDAASTQALLQMPIVISWLLCYIVPLSGNTEFLTYARYIPFTAPFCVPVDVLTGVVSLPEGLLMLAVMLLFTLAFIAVSARIFKGLILYNGQKVSLKTIQGVLKGKQ